MQREEDAGVLPATESATYFIESHPVPVAVQYILRQPSIARSQSPPLTKVSPLRQVQLSYILLQEQES